MGSIRIVILFYTDIIERKTEIKNKNEDSCLCWCLFAMVSANYLLKKKKALAGKDSSLWELIPC